MRFQIYAELYFKALPVMFLYPTVVGINTGINANNQTGDAKPFAQFSTLIGYTSIGILTGITYPISYPLFGGYVLYKNTKS